VESCLVCLDPAEETRLKVLNHRLFCYIVFCTEDEDLDTIGAFMSELYHRFSKESHSTCSFAFQVGSLAPFLSSSLTIHMVLYEALELLPKMWD
jgi:hypothetical protein